MESTSCDSFENVQEIRDGKLDEVDNLSTIVYKQMDREKEEMEEETESTTSLDEILQLNSDLQTGYKILSDLMSDSKKAVNWPFMESVETSAPELFDEYKKRIEKPMWLKLMKRKFEEKQYETITEFVTDFRVMLENCYRFNGPDHYISRRGQKLETMLEQKLNLLSREMREKTSIEATSGLKAEDGGSAFGLRRRPKSIVPHDSTILLNQLREEEQQKVREYRRQQMLDRKAEKEALAQEILDWEDKVLFCGKYKEQMKAMWEIPQIGLFLFLCQGPLNIGEVMHFELERCFLIPRESSTMQLMMMSLLSTPFQRQRIDRKFLMPYKVWEQKLRCKMQAWYKVYTDSGYDKEKACMKLGFDEQFFEIVGRKNPMDKKKYHELSYYKRVWIVKGLCDHILQTQESLRDTIELQPFPDQREYVLGTDAEGLRYIHFPQFCGADLRIYRQAPFKYPKIEIEPDHFNNKRKFPFVYKPPPMKKVKLKKKKSQKPADKVSPSQSPMRQRPSRLRQTPKNVVPLVYGDSSESSSSSSEDEGDTNNDTNTEVEESGGKEDSDDRNDLSGADVDTKSEDRLSSGSDATLPYCEGSDSLSSQSSPDCSRESSPYPTPTDLPSFGLRRSSRLDKSSDVSREASPMIDQLDYSARKGGRNKSRFKNIPPVRATRDLTSFLLDENSTASNSSAFGESSNSIVWRKRLLQTENSVSSDTGEESNSCDINGLFTASKLASNRAEESESDSVSKDLTWRDLRQSNSKLGAKSEGNETDSPNQSDPNMCNGFSNKSDTNHEPELSDLKDNGKSENDSNSIQTDFVETGDNKIDVSESANDIKEESEDVNDLGQDDTSVNAMDVCGQNKDYQSNESPNVSANIKVNDTGRSGLNGLRTEEDNTSQHHRNLDTPQSSEASVEDNHTECDIEQRSQTSKDSHDQELDCSPDIPNSELHKDSERSRSPLDSGTNDRADTKQKLDSPDNSTPYGVQGDTEYSGDLVVRVKEEPMEITEGQTESDKTDDQSNSQWSLEKIKSEYDDTCSTPDNKGTDHVQSVSVKIEPPNKSVLDGSAEGNVKTELDSCKETEVSACKEETDIKEGVKEETVKEEMKEEESEESEEEEEEEPDSSQFQLLADSVEGLRSLTDQFAEQEPIIIRRGKKEQIMKPPPRKRNVVLLHDRLQYLLKELEPWEFKLAQATKRARIRLRKEKETYVEPLEEEDNKWHSADEETESGGSDDEDKGENKDEDKAGRDDLTRKPRPAMDKVLSANNSRSSTPVKLEEPEEIDISQRGRLRKRRIIPNNVEDQFAIKKTRPTIKTEPLVTTQSTPVTTQPVIIQSGKPQMVDYSDILRQLRSASSSSMPGVSPILIKTTQGGRTVLTSVLPIVSGAKTGTPTALASGQNIRFLSTQTLPTKAVGQQQPIKVALPVNAGLGSTKVSQHPTIQTLLSTTTTPGANILPPASSPSPLQQIVTQIPSQNTGALSGIIQTASGQQLILKPQDQAILTQQPGTAPKIVLQSKTTPQKIVPTQQISHHQGAIQGHITPTKVGADLQTTPRKIAPHTAAAVDTSSKGKVKYYAANASTLPINVVQQLLATRGAKLQTGPNQQSILFIPMENEGQTRNVTSTNKVTAAPVRHQFLSPVKTTAETGSVLVTGSVEDNTQTGTKSTTQSKPVNQVTNTPILPKPQAGVLGTQVVNLSPGIQFQATGKAPLTGVQANISKVSKTVKLPDGSISLNVLARNLPPGSPPRYPTNETVRNLLDKRKYGEDKVLPATTITTYPCIASQLQGITPKPLNSSIILKSVPTVSSSAEARLDQPVGSLMVSTPQTAPPLVQISPAAPHVQISPSSSLSVSSVPQVSPDGGKLVDLALSISTSPPQPVAAQPPQHCVITSISPAKLNTLLLQTSAAGAKTIPSLIKLPSKAVLDSAVKAVVTSVNTSLPTVNIKVPSPTSLPSIGPRRNVTKTIQTMKSPIPVAPKVVTQNSGITTLSVANSNTTVLSSQSASLSSGKALVSSTSPVGPTQQTILQSIDGKKVVAKVTPQAVLTSKGIVQMGYITPQNMVLPKTPVTCTQSVSALLNQIGLQADTTGNQSIQGMQLIKNSMGQIQLVPHNSQLLQQVAQKPNLLQFAASSAQSGQATVQLQGMKPVVAEQESYSAISNPSKPTALYTATPVKSPVLGIPPSKSPVLTLPVPIRSPVLHSSNDAAKPVAQTAVGAGYVLPQSASSLTPGHTLAVTQAPVSPMLNMQPNLLLQGSGAGLQLTSPVINPLGLLQQGVALQNTQLLPNSQNVNLLQNSLRSPGLQPMVNVNPLLLNNLVASSANVVAGRPTGPISSVSVAGRMTNLVPSGGQAIQLTKPNILYQANASSVLSGAAKQVANFVNRVPGTETNLAQPVTPLQASLQQALGTTASTEPHAKQLIFQYNVANPRLPATAVSQTPSVSVVKNLNTTFTNVAQDVKRIISPSTVIQPLVNAQEGSLPSPSLQGHPAAPVSYQIQNTSSSTSPTFGTTGSDQFQKTSPTHQKLLLFSIGGQLVTGQGVPVTLSDGVLKLMPQGKIQIANQTLTPAQIQQTLAKINQGLNVTASSQPSAGASQSQMTEPAVKIVNNTVATPASVRMSPVVVPQRPVVQYKDHDYQHKDKGGHHTTSHAGTVNIPAVRVDTGGRDAQSVVEDKNVSLDSSCRSQPVAVGDDGECQNGASGKDGTVKSGGPVYVKPRSNNTGYLMKPMVYSSGYIVCPRTETSSVVPVVVKDITTSSKVKNKPDYDNEGVIAKGPVKTEINGKTDVKVCDRSSGSNDSESYEDDMSESSLVIDDSINEKEAALNLLTLANQALAPVKVKTENPVDKAGDAPNDVNNR